MGNNGNRQGSFFDAQSDGKKAIDIRRLARGEKIETTVAGISGGIIFLDLNAKTEGVLDAAEFTREDGSLSVKPGDTLSVYFLGESPDGAKFTAKFSADNSDLEALEQAYKAGIPVDGSVEKEVKGGFEIKLGKHRAFCPWSQMGGRRDAKDAEGVPAGKKMTFLIQEFKEGGKNIVVSNRAFLEEETKKTVARLQQTIREGAEVEGAVTSLHPFGAFVDIGGIQALVPVSEIRRRRISGVEEMRGIVPEGSVIKAVVLKTDWDRGKISLSMKALERDPWEGVSGRYAPGDRVSGPVSRTADFGVFVSLEEGVDGLVHITELEKAGLVSDSRTNIRKLFAVGDGFNAEILSVDEAGRRISLAPAESREQTEATEKYFGAAADGETYNPFAEFLKKKK